MWFESLESVEAQTVEQEYQAYVNTPLSKEGTDIVKFWEVRSSNS